VLVLDQYVTGNFPTIYLVNFYSVPTCMQTHALSDGSSLQKIEPTRAPIQTALGVLGMPGMTAYMGLLEIGNPRSSGDY
jgi:NADPH-dependent curcumin reductase CurA